MNAGKIVPISPEASPKKSEPLSNPFEPFFERIREIVREEIAAALKGREQVVEKDWLRAEELAELYGLPKTWFEERGRAGEIARTKPGRYVLFARRDVENFLERNKKST